MIKTVKEQAFMMFDLLTVHDQSLIFELMKSLAPDDVATQDDIAVHVKAMEEFKSGETISHDCIDWS